MLLRLAPLHLNGSDSLAFEALDPVLVFSLRVKDLNKASEQNNHFRWDLCLAALGATTSLQLHPRWFLRGLEHRIPETGSTIYIPGVVVDAPAESR
jgi:hypothetical protein